ncbi:Hcp family type VI secretion system effector [Massilia horti]|uniref:Type VI secretion system tube protein Hcp n=1 Tax=Massilia horti TaxID=2562153 RepID=A0A4Y9SVA3_9BURK|nr:type VI secretion system tube protein Hcp [Massilia horti]TFW28583.1 type VI secretion system tube protein Hcp [Massilia horti]
MASDVYLQIEGIKGESMDEKHKDSIEVISVTWGNEQPTAGPVSTSGGHTIGRASFDPVHFTKLVDLASPKLMELVAQGRTIPKATLKFMRADGANRIKYYELTLCNVLVSSNKKSFSGSGLLVEQFTLHYSKILETYTQQKIGGGAGGNTMGGWDLASNKTAA